MFYRFSNFLSRFISALSFLVLIILISAQICYSSTVTQNWHEIPVFRLNNWETIVAFLVATVIFYLSCPLLMKIPSKLVLAFVLIIFICGSLYVTLRADTTLRLSDQLFCWQAANQFNHGNFEMLKPREYVGTAPWQLGWVSFLRIIQHFHGGIRQIYILNVVFQSISIVLIYVICQQIWHDRLINNLSLVLSGLFLPNIFNNLFVYGTIIGYSFFLLAVAFSVKYVNHPAISNILGMVISIAIAFSLKSNFQIGVLALVILSIILILKKFSWLRLLAIILLLLSVPATNFALGHYYSATSNINVSLTQSGQPKSAFFAMGLQTSRTPTKDGWFNGYNVHVYQQSHYNHELADQIARKKLNRQISYFYHQPHMVAGLLFNKLISTWTDPTFQSIWNGPQPDWGSKVKTSLMAKIYTPNESSRTDKLIHLICKVEVFLIVLGAIIANGLLFSRDGRKANLIVLLPLIYLLGGFLYHLLSETKSQYVLIYIYTLIPLAGFGLSYAYHTLGKLQFSHHQRG